MDQDTGLGRREQAECSTADVGVEVLIIDVLRHQPVDERVGTRSRESEKERESKDTFSVLDKQVKKGLEGFPSEDLERLVIAYEPVWAIGTGKTATSDQAQEAHQFLRSVIEKKFGNMLAKSIRILYGGSVKPNNIAELMTMPDVDGALVGGASLDPETFSKIVQFKI